jgi:hypothetical protein
MPEDDINNLKNHQLLEICGLEIFKTISKNKVIEDTRGEPGGVTSGNRFLKKNKNGEI